MECVFCKIVSGEILKERIYENENFFSIPDVNPVAEGHSLIISKKHFETVLDLPESLGSELMNCIKKTALEVIQDNGAEGFNILNNNFEVAGQVVKHLHFHIVPRKKGDGKKGVLIG